MNQSDPRDVSADLGALPLRPRVVVLEAVLACIHRECERALDEPTILFGTICRVATVTRQALRSPLAPE